MPSDFLFEIRELADKTIRRVFDRRLKDGQIDDDLFKTTALEYWEALQEGMGSHASMEYTDTKLDTIESMRRNLFTFVAFKNHSNVSDLVDALTEGNKIKPWHKFKADALKISADYNENWLRAEYNTVVSTGQMSAKWADYQEAKEFLPFLRYKTQADDLVRASHAELHDVTKNIDDPFWDEFYPPNGWNCRCYTLQVSDGETTEETPLPDEKEVPLLFRRNAAKLGEVFDRQHPYFTSVTIKERKSVLNQMRNSLIDEDLFDKTFQDERTGATVQTHILHDQNERDENIDFAKRLARSGISGRLLPVDNRTSKRNIDFQIDTGQLVELKRVKVLTVNAISKSIIRASKQGAEIAALFIDSEMDLRILRNGILQGLRKAQITDVWIYYIDRLIRVNAENAIDIIERI